jgi:hypothetical protein
MRREFIDLLAIQNDLPRGRKFKPGDHTQSGGLAAAGWAEQCHQFTLLDLKINIVHRSDFAYSAARRKNFGYMV